MKTCLITCFLLFSNITISQSDRRLIKQIDSISTSAIYSFSNNKILESFKLFNKVKKISQTVDDDYGKSISNFYLGNIYILMHEYEDANRSYKAMLKPSAEINDNYLLGISYLNLSKLAKKEKDNKNSSAYLQKALHHVTKPEFLADNNYNADKKYDLLQQIGIELSESYIENGVLDKALISLLHFDEYLTKSPSVNNYYKGYYDYLNALYLTKKKLYNNAIIKFEEALQSLNKRDLIKYENSYLLFDM